MRIRVLTGILVLTLVALVATLRPSWYLEVESGEREEHDEGGEELPPNLHKKFAAMATFSPGSASLLEEAAGGTGAMDWIQHSTPGTDIPFAAFAGARSDWLNLKARPAVGGGAWTPLGPVYGKGATNPYRDRSVYNAGTDNFGGRSIAAAIDPDCVAGDCRLWLANANGGVWMTPDALAAEPAWQFQSHTFEHNNVAALELDPNDAAANTIWAGTGEPNACGSGCTAGVGLYRSTNGGKSWQGPVGQAQFAGRAVGSIAVQSGNSNVVFAASGRGVLGVSNTCCGGVDALIPGAPHFGLYRSLDAGSTWQLVSQGAANLCTSNTPDQVALNQTACSPRGARRVMFDPSDPNTVYVSFFSRGIWRSRNLGDSWEQILPLVGSATSTAERAEFDVTTLPSGETRMYVGVGGGGMTAHFRRNDAVRNPAASAVAAGWQVLSSTSLANAAGFSSIGYCDGQCSYDNYVFVPPGAGPDTVYLVGDYEYSENNYVTGRSNGRGILLSTNAGVHFTDMTEDASDNRYPVQAHPDHHAIVTNPGNWRQFFDVGDGGIIRSNGNFVNDSGDCTAVKQLNNAARIAFCQLVLSRIPERLEPINKGLRTLHFYQIDYNKANPDIIAGGTQDNGSWETIGGDTWLNTNIADGGHNGFDALGGNPDFRMTGWQQGQIEVSFTPQNQTDVTWVADTMFYFYAGEAVPFIGNAITDPVVPGRLWHGREHIFRAGNHGLNPAFPRATVLAECNVWTGSGDLNGDGSVTIADVCDDFKPLGNPAAAGRLTDAIYGDRTGGLVAVVERGRGDESTLWAATSTGRIFISKNADHVTPSSVAFTRLDDDSTADPPRYPTSIFVDPADPNHAWITYSGFNAKTPATPGHVFEVRFDPATNLATFTNLDGHKNNGFGDIPATSIVVSDKGTLYVGTDFGVVQKQKNSPVWHLPAAGLPNVTVADLVLVPERGVLYAGTHGQGVWQLKVH